MSGRAKPLDGVENVIVQRIGENGPTVYAAPGHKIYIEGICRSGLYERIIVDPSEQDELNAALWIARVVSDCKDISGLIAQGEAAREDEKKAMGR